MATEGLTAVAPQNMLDILSDYHELVNTPRIGSASNIFWHSQQLNIAPAQHGDSGMLHTDARPSSGDSLT